MLPQKRTEILYSRVTKKNKKFIQALARKEDRSEAELVDYIIDLYRRGNASNTKKSK